MIRIDGREYPRFQVSSVNLVPLQSRQASEIKLVDGTVSTNVHSAGHRGFRDYVLEVGFGNDAQIPEDLYQHLKGLEIAQAYFQLSLSPMSRNFATLTPLDKIGKVWATPTWPIYPHHVSGEWELEDFSYNLYVNRTCVLSGYTVDRELGIVEFDIPLGVMPEVLMRYTWVTTARMASANYQDGISLDWKTGSISFECRNSVINSIIEFEEVFICPGETLSPSAIFSVGAEMYVVPTVRSVPTPIFEVGVAMDCFAVVKSPTIEISADFQVGVTLEAGGVTNVYPILISADFQVGSILEAFVDLNEPQANRVTLFADGMQIYQFSLYPDQFNDYVIQNEIIPESVWENILDWDSLQVKIERFFGNQFQVDKVAIHTGPFEANEALFEVGVEFQCAAVVLAGNVIPREVEMFVGAELLITANVTGTIIGEETDPDHSDLEHGHSSRGD